MTQCPVAEGRTLLPGLYQGAVFMKQSILLAAAVALAACAGQAEDETAAAPAPDATTAVTHAIDSARTGPPGVSGRPPNATITPDSVLDDTTVVRGDTMYTESGPISVPQDTLGPSGGLDTTVQVDTAGQTDTTGWQ
jgi:hypothetical protein